MYDTDFITNGASTVGINPEGGYVISWKVNGENILYMGSTIRRTGIPILFPYYGKARNREMHGFGRNSLWRIVGKTVSSAVMELIHDQVIIQIKLALPDPQQLEYTLSVVNNSEEKYPISPGLHPYWSVAHQDKKKIAIAGIESLNAASIDWDNEPPDTAFPFKGRLIADLINKKIKIEEISDHKVIKYIQIWSQTPVRDPDFNFVCIEPICGLNYGIDNAPILIEKNSQWEMRVRFSVLLSN
ncbi:MAG: hypothetical protein M3Q44_06585 [bacterium]|nr:hypothetical protein [bacterium]